MKTEPALLLTRSVRRQMSEHVLQCLPSEAVGLLAGHRDGPAQIAVPLPNLGGSRNFFVDPRTQFEAERFVQSMGFEVVAIYHSHPDGTATLSPLDQLFASPHLIQLIISVSESGLNEVARAYQCGEETVELPVILI